MTLEEKEVLIKTAIKKKIRIFSITPQGQIGYMEALLKGYRVLPTFILALYEVEGVGDSVINADLVQVFDDEKKDWIDLFYTGRDMGNGVTMMPLAEPVLVKKEEEDADKKSSPDSTGI